MKKLKFIKIEEEFHNKFKIFCIKNGLKLNTYAQKILMKHYKETLNDNN